MWQGKYKLIEKERRRNQRLCLVQNRKRKQERIDEYYEVQNSRKNFEIEKENKSPIDCCTRVNHSIITK